MVNGAQVGIPTLHYRCAAGHEFWVSEPADQRWAAVRAATSAEELARLGGIEERGAGEQAPVQAIKCPGVGCAEFTYLQGQTQIEGDEEELWDSLPVLKYECSGGHLTYTTHEPVPATATHPETT